MLLRLTFGGMFTFLKMGTECVEGEVNTSTAKSVIRNNALYLVKLGDSAYLNVSKGRLGVSTCSVPFYFQCDGSAAKVTTHQSVRIRARTSEAMGGLHFWQQNRQGNLYANRLSGLSRHNETLSYDGERRVLSTSTALHAFELPERAPARGPPNLRGLGINNTGIWLEGDYGNASIRLHGEPTDLPKSAT
ncbi:unnamed protein product, partial [Mesorhabditis spiculigera]